MIDGRVTLRRIRTSDAEAFMTWAGDPEVTRSLFWDHYVDLEAAKEHLAVVAQPHPWYHAVCLDGAPIGAVTLDRGTGRAARRAELGYVIARSHWGKGAATAAVRAALGRGFRDLGIDRIEAFVDPENAGSIRVLEKAGLVREAHLRCYLLHRGKVRDRYIYAKIRD